MMARQRPYSLANPVDLASSPKPASVGKHPVPPALWVARRITGLVDRGLGAVVFLGLRAGRLAQRFPHWLGWTRRLW